MGILKNHSDDNYYVRTFDDFIGRLERGELPIKALLPWDTYGSECIDCEEKVIRFKYRGERYDLHQNSGRWIIHQCPQPTEIWPDDPNVRDGDGNIRMDDWSDDQDRRHDQFPDDPYNYPDIPYVDPTK